jgi:hypothetical protein
MINQIKGPAKNILASLIFIGGIHIMLLEYFLPDIYLDISLIYIYIFLAAFSLIGIWAILMVQKVNSELMPQALLSYTVIKFLGSLVFLLPSLLDKTDFTKPFIYQFFGIFFPILLIESVVFMRIVNKPNSENDKKL